MVNVITSAVTSLVVTVSFFSILHYLQQDRVWGKPSIHQVEQSTTDLALQAQLASLQNEIVEIRDYLESVEFSSNDGAENKNQIAKVSLNERIRKLELAVAEISAKGSGGISKDSQAVRPGVKEYMEQAGQFVAEQRSALAETQFEADSGLPLGDFIDSVEDVIHEIDGIEARGIACRNTICKITYTNNEAMPSGPEDFEWQLMDRLLERAAGRQVDITYANDSFGNNTMYIQLK